MFTGLIFLRNSCVRLIQNFPHRYCLHTSISRKLHSLPYSQFLHAALVTYDFGVPVFFCGSLLQLRCFGGSTTLLDSTTTSATDTPFTLPSVKFYLFCIPNSPAQFLLPKILAFLGLFLALSSNSDVLGGSTCSLSRRFLACVAILLVFILLNFFNYHYRSSSYSIAFQTSSISSFELNVELPYFLTVFVN